MFSNSQLLKVYLKDSITDLESFYVQNLKTFYEGAPSDRTMCDEASATTIPTPIITTGSTFHGGGGGYFENYGTLCIMEVLYEWV